MSANAPATADVRSPFSNGTPEARSVVSDSAAKTSTTRICAPVVTVASAGALDGERAAASIPQGRFLFHVHALDGVGVLFDDDLAPDLERGGDLLGVEAEVPRQDAPILDALRVRQLAVDPLDRPADRLQHLRVGREVGHVGVG